MFKITMGKGFQITFENGWTISVQWGPENYSDNYGGDFKQQTKYGEAGSKCAETAAWDSNGKWFKFEHDEVAGYQTPAEVLTFMNKVASL